jgi:GNAT superfamily N-acetyltransferase
MVVRVAGIDDLHRLGEFFLRAWREAGPGAPGFTGANEDVVRELASERSLRAKLTSPTLRVFVAEDKDGILGFASVKRTNSDETELSGIIVLQSMVGRGVGTALFNFAREYAASEGYQSMLVKTEASNQTAIAFYKKVGFVETAETVEDVEGTKVRLKVLERKIPWPNSQSETSESSAREENREGVQRSEPFLG